MMINAKIITIILIILILEKSWFDKKYYHDEYDFTKIHINFWIIFDFQKKSTKIEL